MPTFFDLLPNDIHDTIAHFLFSSTKYPEKQVCHSCLIDSIADDNLLDTLLDYAKSSPAQCRSVVRAISKRLFITNDWRKQRVLDWISVSANYLQIIELWTAPEFSFPGGSPHLPQLERAFIITRPEQLSLIHGSPKLRVLTVGITNSHCWDSFVSTVGSLQLWGLHLIFVSAKILQDLSIFELMSLRAACPSLEALYFEGVARLTKPAWDMIKGMRSLKKLRVVAPIPDEHISFVQTLPNVSLLGVRNIQQATQFGAAITSLTLFHVYEEDIIRLESLPNLQRLRIKPVQGHERALVGKINNLEELGLTWDYDDCEHPYETVDGVRTGWHPIYYKPDADVLKEILKSAKQLKSLHFQNATLSSELVTDLLEIVGHNLETLGICHDWQKECVPDRMERILKGIARHCPNLRTLVFKESDHCCQGRLPIFATEEQKVKCFRALDEVAEKVPGFRSYRHVRLIILHRFTAEPFAVLTWHDILKELCTVLQEDGEVEDEDNEDSSDDEDEDEGEDDYDYEYDHDEEEAEEAGEEGDLVAA